MFTLSQRLREFGVESWIDQYDEVPPPQSWPLWMFQRIDEAQFVLVICTATYRRRVEGHEARGVGRGAIWEGGVITQELYEQPAGAPVKFIPVLLQGANEADIPYFLRSTTYYRIDHEELDSYRGLLEHLLGRPRVKPAPLGTPPADLGSLRLQTKVPTPHKDSGSPTPNDLNRVVPLLELLGDSSLSPATLLDRWTSVSRTAPVVLGLGTAGAVTWDPVTEGPHALVGGTTGSGKSAFLQTLLASIALTYSPERWNFLLVDYKGGAAFGPLYRLPHTIGLVTELDSYEVRRLGDLLDAEIARRQSMLADVGATSYDDFSARFNTDKVLPRLMIVVDEFAALVAEHPQFMAMLLAVGRVGRSLGVHLVLATQRPAGVIRPEMKTMFNARFALRLADHADSTDIMGSPVAADLPYTPGLVYLSSHGSSPVLFRAAYGGLTVLGSSADGYQRDHIPTIDSVAKVTIDASALLRRWARRTMWLPALPLQFPLVLNEQGAHADLQRMIGVQDFPSQQRQKAWLLELAPLQSLHVVGTTGSGKSTTLITTVTVASRNLDAADLEVYAVGFREEDRLTAISALPHTRFMGGPSKPAEILSIFRLLAAEVERRELAWDHSSTSIWSRSGALSTVGPKLLVVVDDLHLLISAHPDSKGPLRRIARANPDLGVAIVLSTDFGRARDDCIAGIDQKLILQLSNDRDYDAFGIERDQLPRVLPPGRGLLLPPGIETQVGFIG